MFGATLTIVFFTLPVQFDEDSGLISDAFIEAVAAIVLQTTIRRFLAIRRAQRLRMGAVAPGGSRKQATPLRKTPAPRMTEERHQEVNRQMHPAAKQVHFSDPSLEQLSEQHPFHEFYDLAAIQIQSVFRGWWVRDSINVDH